MSWNSLIFAQRFNDVIPAESTEASPSRQSSPLFTRGSQSQEI